MKMVKSLLLGTAAGLVAVAGAQAADLPVKAKPVQYVKICSLYGAGFYYIPGTDMCLKIGGWVRFESAWGTNGNSVLMPIADLNNRSTNNLWWRIRGYVTADARNQSEYGTIRSYIAVGISTNESLDEQQVFNANRAFIQFAGFTFGRAASFYDFYGGAATSYFGFYPQSDTGDGGKDVLGYTAQFGGGWSASLAAEQRRTTQIIGQINTAGGVGVLTGTVGGAGYGGWQVPDFVANLRVDQPWGSAQIMGALHQVNANYYRNSTTAVFPEASGHPSDKWGFAVGAGAKLLTPFISPGDYLHFQVNYTEGATRYIFQNPAGNFFFGDGLNVGYGILSDAVYGSLSGTPATQATDLNLTTAWGVNAAYEHFWSKQWRTSVHGGYTEVKYNSEANAILCQLQGDGAGFGTLAVGNPGCNNDWKFWWIGSRTQWNITPDTYLGLDVAYMHLNSATSSNGFAGFVVPAGTAQTRTISDSDQWIGRFRVHRDFYP